MEGVSWKKYGFFDADKKCFSEIAAAVGLVKKLDEEYVWGRHPLAYLVEAADDMCYRVNDLEDGFRLKHVSLKEAQDLLLSIFGPGAAPTKWQDIGTEEDKIGYLRAKAINYLIDQSITYFQNHSHHILEGKLETSLIDGIPSASALSGIIKISKEKIYRAREVLEIEAAGFQVLGELLEVFLTAANDIAQKGEKRATAKKPNHFLSFTSTISGDGR